MSRLERLINLTAALLNTERLLTADELHARVPGYADDRATFRRAFERDKETLREMGMPISVGPLDPDDPNLLGYRIRPDEYYLPDPRLEPDEAAALHLAASAVRLEGAGGVEALWKLGGEVAEGGPVAELAALPGAAHLVPLFGAISVRQVVSFAYRDETREVEPFRLSFRNGHWYLAGLDRTRGEERSFRVDRIAGGVARAGEAGAFERPAVTGRQPPPWLLGGDEPVSARLLVDADHAGWAIGQVGPTSIEERRPDGSVVLGVHVTNRSAFRSFVLGFLDHAEVLGPPELRAEMVGWLEAMCRAVSADDRLRRLLALVPWVAAHDGPTVDEVCTRFGCTEQELVEDLELLFLCGLYPYTPDVLIETDITAGRVWIRYAEYFSRPLRLTPDEGLALLAKARTLLAVPGSDPSGPLARGLAKLARVVGVDPEEALEIEINPVATEVIDLMRRAVAEHRQVQMEYYSFGRDSATSRVIDPYSVFAASGQWYVSAFCHSVDDERLFRLDRVRVATPLDTTFTAPTVAPDLTVYQPQADDPRVELDLEPGARWVIEQYPVEAVEARPDGGWRVRLVASERAWLERLLLRLGRDARVVEGPVEAGREAAARLLARYR